MTSPCTDRRRSVTSSGRSPTSTTIRCTSGWLAATAAAIACSTIVLPAFGGDTMRPRWPLPIGLTRSPIPAGSATPRRDRLQPLRLACLRRRHDEAALALADRAHQVDDPCRRRAPRRLEAKALLRVDGRQCAEVGALHREAWLQAVDGVETGQRAALLVCAAPAQ